MTYCTKCGTQLGEGDVFCAECGTPRKAGEGAAARPKSRRGLKRRPSDEPEPEQPSDEPEPKQPEQPGPPKSKAKKKRRLRRGCLWTLAVLAVVLLVLTGAAWAYARSEFLKVGNPHLMLEDAVGQPYADWLVTALVLPRPVEFSKPDRINDEMAFIENYWTEDTTDTAGSEEDTATATGTSDDTAIGTGVDTTASTGQAGYPELNGHYRVLWRLHRSIGVRVPGAVNDGYGFVYDDFYRRVGRGSDAERAALVGRCEALLDRVYAKRAALKALQLDPAYASQRLALLRLYGHLVSRMRAVRDAAESVVGVGGCRGCRPVVEGEEAARAAFERAYRSARPRQLH